MRMRLGFDIAALAIATVVAAGLDGCNCGDKQLGGVPGNLAGQVCYPDSGAGLAGAAITITGPVTRTSLADGTGHYTFELIPKGTYKLHAVLGSVTRDFDATVAPQKSAADGDTIVNDTACRATPIDPNAGELDGQVCNRHTGQYVTDAHVTLKSGDNVYDTTTDATGAFKLPGVPEGDHVVEVSGAGYQRAFAVTIQAKQTTELDLAEGCQPVSATEGGMRGFFCDPSAADPHNTNLVGATVTATLLDASGNPTQETYTDITDTTGEFEMNGLEPGTYNVDVAGALARFTLSDIVVTPANETLVTDDADCGSPHLLGRIEGQLCNFDAGGAFTGTVDLLDPTGTSLVKSTTTDDQGAFTMNQIDPGSYLLHIHKDTAPVYSKNYPVTVAAFDTFHVQDGACPPPQDQCSQTINQPQVSTDGRIFLVVDRSGSMGDPDAGGTQKWQSIKTALEQVTGNLTQNVEFGLTMFPQPGAADLCQAGGSVEVGLAKNTAPQIASNLEAVAPQGGTPTAATLDFVKNQLVQGGFTTDGRPLAVLIATDGGPNCNAQLDGFGSTCRCTQPADPPGQCSHDNCLDDLNTINAVGQLKDLGVKVFVIGEVGSENFTDVLDNMATVGGTALPGEPRFYQATNEANLESAINEIVNSVLSCHVAVPNVNLAQADSVTVSIGTQTIARDQSHLNGWDIAGDGVDLYGSACDTASSSSDNVTVRTCFPP